MEMKREHAAYGREHVMAEKAARADISHTRGALLRKAAEEVTEVVSTAGEAMVMGLLEGERMAKVASAEERMAAGRLGGWRRGWWGRPLGGVYFAK